MSPGKKERTSCSVWTMRLAFVGTIHEYFAIRTTVPGWTSRVNLKWKQMLINNLTLQFFFANHLFIYLFNALWWKEHQGYCNQIWYQVAPLCRLSVYQISRQSDNSIVQLSHLYEKKKKKQKKKNEETQPTFKGSYLGNVWRDLVEIWNVRWWRWLAFPALKSFSFIKVSRSYSTFTWKLHYCSSC